jgi:cysteine desulfurase
MYNIKKVIKMIYLDYASTTPIRKEVMDTYIKTQNNFFANTTSLHKLGQESNFMFQKAKKDLLDSLHLENHDAIFTANATEANNLGIFGIVKKYSTGKIITTRIEHPSVFEAIKELEKLNYDVVYLDVDKNGIIDLDQLKIEMNNSVVLVSVMWVNNIVGSIQPIEKIIDILKPYKKAKLHVDIVQGLGKIIPLFDFNNVDLLSFSTHKIYGPKGIGCLLCNNKLDLKKCLFGSNSQRGVKPGTIDLALIVATTKAVKICLEELENNYKYVKEINNYFREQLISNDKITINSSKDSSPYIINISVPSIYGETIVHMFEEKDIYISTGSACSSKLRKIERTIYAMTNNKELAKTSVRISFSHLTSIDEVNAVVLLLKSL